MRRKLISLIIGLGVLMVPLRASAQVVVTPAAVNIGEFQTFTVGVATEKEVSTTGVRLVVPDAINAVTPNVKPGWLIEVKKTNDKASEIIWTGGTIPPQQRDEFSFSAEAPAQAGSLVWVVHQTFQDGSVIAWDQKDEPDPAVPDKGPYSVTAVINDSAEAPADPATQTSARGAYVLAGVALIVSIAALVYKRQ